ncbi:ankyrin repeat, PH and SEC7 domain containing protein secG-like [Haliotis cracherodii]|uniref:ankyrin repeat, PH and SEC7 domain containing protein secG-like n=1 Tax=Haliotis cracherodii TaxID=6455 RepID=UPI0039E8EE5A
MTPAMWAARRGRREVIDLLEKKKADLELVDGFSYNILHWACHGGHVAMVKHIVSKNMVDINSKGQDGRTPVMCAARAGEKRMFELLVSKGDLPLGVDYDGNNILLLACFGGNVKIVEYIISHDAPNINCTGESGRTPLMAAAYKGHGHIFDLLVTKGADLTPVDDAGDNILHVACLGGDVDVVTRLLEQGKVDINSRGHYSRTPLMMAARRGEHDIFRLLVNKEADASPVDDDSNNILHLACKGGQLEIVKYILGNMMTDIVDINARNQRNETATMRATNGSEVRNLLVSRGGCTR